jgi:hypothetical protein
MKKGLVEADAVAFDGYRVIKYRGVLVGVDSAVGVEDG